MIAEQAPVCPSCNKNRCQARGAKKDGRKDYRGRCKPCRKSHPIPQGHRVKMQKPIGFALHSGQAVALVDGYAVPAAPAPPVFRLVLNKKGLKKEMVSPCAKKAYTKKDAQTAANKRMKEGVEYIRIYPCPKGDGAHWHLTHEKR